MELINNNTTIVDIIDDGLVQFVLHTPVAAAIDSLQQLIDDDDAPASMAALAQGQLNDLLALIN